jgi:pyridoxal 5'-phosphate synthase glutaminase subunit Pdx2
VVTPVDGGSTRRPLVGVFALQGDFARHRTAWERAGADTREVRTAADLLGLDALSLPGGESTTMLRLLDVTGLLVPFGEALRRLPVFATCAGAILLGRGATRLPVPPFATMDLDVERNAYGRQIDSFEAELEAPALGPGERVTGVFIRAPQLQVRDYLVAGPYKNLKKYKPQDWNEIVVVVKGTVAHCTCNGEVLEEALKVPATGGIGLEADRGQMEYRRIRLKEIK